MLSPAAAHFASRTFLYFRFRFGFSGKSAFVKVSNGIVLLKSFEDYYSGYEDEQGWYHPGYVDLLEKLETEFPLDAAISEEQAEKDFISLCQALRNPAIFVSLRSAKCQQNVSVLAVKCQKPSV